MLRDLDHDGVAEVRETFATGLNRPFGLAFWKNYLYIGNTGSVVRFHYKEGQTKSEGAPETVVADLPALGGNAVSEKRHLNPYRVQLRVVEEYDVALLAESPDDAKARAEADLRTGEQFEDIQDSWPEEIVSVEALAVEPYPELE